MSNSDDIDLHRLLELLESGEWIPVIRKSDGAAFLLPAVDFGEGDPAFRVIPPPEVIGTLLDGRVLH